MAVPKLLGFVAQTKALLYAALTTTKGITHVWYYQPSLRLMLLPEPVEGRSLSLSKGDCVVLTGITPSTSSGSGGGVGTNNFGDTLLSRS